MIMPVLFEELIAKNGKRIAIATLNAEKSLNAISLEMVDLLYPQLRRWADDPTIAMVMLQAAGDKAFCAGGDLQDLYRTTVEQHQLADRENILNYRFAGAFFEREYRLDYLIHTFPKPILAWGHGIVMGGGMGLMAGASHRVVTEKSRLAMPEIAIGLYPDVGGTWFLNRMPGHIGLFLALTGVSINAADAIFAKLADVQIAQADKALVLDALLSQEWNGGVCRDADAALLTRVLQSYADKLALSNSPLITHFNLINQLCSAPTLPEIVSTILDVQSEDVWLQKAAAGLAAGSPGSAYLSYVLQQRARHMSLAEVFRLEYAVSLHCVARTDLVEGIRALIVDKDRQPKWLHTNVTEVSEEWLQGFFQNPWSRDDHPLADLA
ncbi:MAG: enoyl-CoA hydratase/isomerase family protein [Glaciimonas sp.]|nr:enoyl-CoA hydratase/isomerase family protein [Glaciimonas sp.]